MPLALSNRPTPDWSWWPHSCCRTSHCFMFQGGFHVQTRAGAPSRATSFRLGCTSVFEYVQTHDCPVDNAKLATVSTTLLGSTGRNPEK